MQVLWYIIGIVAIAFVVAASIALHELGHLFWAKRFGIRVNQYMIGFGPTLFSWRRGETEYGFKAIPLGGYISMIGMYPPAPDARPDGEPVRVSRGRLAEMVRGARRASAETIPPGEEHRAFYRQAVWKRLLIMFGGPLMNLIIALVCYAVLVSAFGTVQSTTSLSSVSQCVLPTTEQRSDCRPDDPAAPGAEAGLKPGDQLLVINGDDVERWSDVQSIVQPLAGQTVSVTLLRDGQVQTVSLTPQPVERFVYDKFGRVERDADGQKKTETVGFIGITPTSERVRQPVTAAVPAMRDNLQLAWEGIISMPQKLVGAAQAAFGSEARDPDGPMSIVGVGRVAGELTSSDQIGLTDKVASLVGLAASLNVALFAFNMIPLMPLDGGHIVGALYEGLRRRLARLFGRRDPGPFDTARLMPLTLVVFGALTLMGVLLIYADLVKPIQVLG
ncbi:M50 family metallopeptidase [Pseudoclavibacter sp. CFCC 13611]|uniref:M50 family metallopeptidase n=1 Tax=Pseudoclavibacter sp. CFCC 13611 TaxID=2615178 RepID=UPI001301105F|nr:site-2 protease family protein [Pseudoclavibacter sp. CFCC 13611]KAB1664286.1 site-2 protease family protein [Pseudoclavibacter sp. CFCC 13611]